MQEWRQRGRDAMTVTTCREAGPCSRAHSGRWRGKNLPTPTRRALALGLKAREERLIPGAKSIAIEGACGRPCTAVPCVSDRPGHAHSSVATSGGRWASSRRLPCNSSIRRRGSSPFGAITTVPAVTDLPGLEGGVLVALVMMLVIVPTAALWARCWRGREPADRRAAEERALCGRGRLCGSELGANETPVAERVGEPTKCEQFQEAAPLGHLSRAAETARRFRCQALMTTVPAIRSNQPRWRLSMKIQM